MSFSHRTDYRVKFQQMPARPASPLSPVLVAMGLLAAVLLFAGCRLFPPVQAPFEPHVDLSGGLPVFPGAAGFGSTTVAGREGAVIVVSNLNNDGAGSLREALLAEGPRVVVFEVAGVIELASRIDVVTPYLTIAGQTSPDPGITLIGSGIVISTHDVLVQHIRTRPGDGEVGDDPENRDGIGVVGDRRGRTEVYNVVIDHCSVSWAIDEGMSTWYEGVHDVTFSNCIVAENLSESLHPKGEHSKGLLVGDHSRRIAVIGNLFAHNTRRNPLLKGDTSALVAGNLIYNPGTQAVGFSDPEWSGPSRATIVGNVFIPGPDTDGSTELLWRGSETSDNIQVYINDNLVIEGTTSDFLPPASIAEVLVTDPPVSVTPFSPAAASTIESAILAGAGARAASRDGTDTRIVQSVVNRSGAIIDSQDEVGGYPVVAPVTAGLTIPPDPSGDDDADGYTNLEEWLHGLAEAVEAP